MTVTDQLEIVEQLVLQERKIVTYGWLSRYLNIQTNRAKQLLYKFIAEKRSSSENNIHVIYCICGLTANNNQHTVTLVTQEKLEAAIKDFNRLTSIHVYSVQSECPTEAELIKADREPIDKVVSECVLPSNINKDASSAISTDKPLVSQPVNVKKESLNNSIPPEKADEKKPAKNKHTSSEKSKPIKNTSSKEKQLINKQNSDKFSDIASLLSKAASDESKTSNKKAKKRKSDEIEGNLDEQDFGDLKEEEQTTNKQKNGNGDIGFLWNKADSQNKVTTKDKVVKKRKNGKVADGLDQQEVKALQITNERKDDKPDIVSLLNNKPASQNKIAEKRRIDSMIEDDLDNAAEKGSKQHKLHKVDKTEQQRNVVDDVMDINNDSVDEKDQPQDQQSALPTVLQKKRGRRQVSKSRSYVNERGYTVHENYHEWESFSEDESVPEPSAKKPHKATHKAIKAEEPNVTAKRGKKKKGDNGSQKSLLSFFGRK